MKKIVIVGGGASGVLVATNLVRNAIEPLSISIIEPGDVLGKGIAYGTSDPDHLLNVPAGRMSAFEEVSDHFVKWSKVSEGDFVSRKKYGEYLNENLTKELNAKSKQIELSHIRDSVKNIEHYEDGFTCYLSQGDIVKADYVVLATGHQGLITPIKLMPFIDHPNVVNDVWQQPIKKNYNQVAIIGTGLTFYDVALSYLRDNPTAKIYGISRNGLLPSPHLKHREPPLPVPDIARSSAQGIRDYLISVGERWREAQDGIRHDLQEIWANFPEYEKRNFFDKYFRWWNVLRHRSAPEIHEKVQQYISSGSMEIIPGEISEVHPYQDRFKIVLADGRELEVEQIINCCGNGFEITSQLLLDLIAAGLCCRGPLGFGIAVDTTSLQVKNSKEEIVAGLYAIGPILVGELLETTAIPEIKVQANQISHRILVS